MLLFSENVSNTTREVLTVCVLGINVLFVAFAFYGIFLHARISRNKEVDTRGEELSDIAAKPACENWSSPTTPSCKSLKLQENDVDEVLSLGPEKRTRELSIDTSTPLPQECEASQDLVPSLPNEWTEVVPAGGQLYFWNEKTGETSWTRPEPQV